MSVGSLGSALGLVSGVAQGEDDGVLIETGKHKEDITVIDRLVSQLVPRVVIFAQPVCVLDDIYPENN